MKTNLLIIIGLIYIFVAGTVYTTNEFKVFHIPFLIIGFSFLFIFVFLSINKKLEFEKYLILIIILQTMFMSISSLKNSDSYLLISMFGLVGSLIVLIYVSASQNERKMKYFEMIWRLVLVLGSVVIMYSFLLYPISSQSYKGVFYTSNAFGNMIASLSSAVIAKIFLKLSIKKKIYIDVTLLFILFYLVLISGSRTSLIALVFTVSILAIVYLILKGTSVVRFIKLMVMYSISLILLFFISTKIDAVNNALENRIINKFIKKSNNQLDGRGEVWIETINSASIFGNGRDHFLSLGLGHGAHNTFISLLGQYGWATLIIFLVFLIYILSKSLKLLMSNKDYTQFYTLATGNSFIFLSLGEGMLMKFSMFLFFVTIGSLINHEKKEKSVLYN